MKTRFTILLMAIAFGASAQDVEFKAANFKDNKEGFQTALAAFEKGNEYWLLGNEQVFLVKNPKLNYWKALEQYNKAYKFNPKSAELNLKMGICYAHSSYKEKSIPYIYEAYKLNPLCNPFMNYYMGIACQLDGKYDEALKYYVAFETEYRKADNFNKFTGQRKDECNSAKALMASPIRAWIDHVPELSSEADDYAPSVTLDGDEIIFTSNRSNGHTPDEVGGYDADIYSSTKVDGKWQTPKALRGSVNTIKDDISNNLSYTGTRMLYSVLNENGNYDIYEAFLKGAEWTGSVNFSTNINMKSNDIFASYDFDDKLLYYAKDSESGTGGYDIFVSGPIVKRNREYSMPTRLNEISSGFNDGPIYLHPDGKTMYFASEGFNSMGGYDIFMSKKKGGIWSAPINMGSPINTPYDDYFFAATANGKYAYIASNRAGGKGGFDIYRVTFWGPEKKPALATQDYLLASVAKPIQDPELIGEVKVAATINLTVFKGLTIDALTKKPVEATIDITDNATGKITESFTTNSATGKFLISLNAGGNYGIAVKADGYLFHSENFDIPSTADYNMVNKTIELKNIKCGSKIALRNVFFDTGKSTIRTESYPELDRLVKLMNDVPTLKVELSGHTDNTGSATSNQELSQNRAQAVVDYLVSKGINKTRMVAKGYGSDRPVTSNASAEGRQENRRTEFEIVC